MYGRQPVPNGRSTQVCVFCLESGSRPSCLLEVCAMLSALASRAWSPLLLAPSLYVASLYVASVVILPRVHLTSFPLLCLMSLTPAEQLYCLSSSEAQQQAPHHHRIWTPPFLGPIFIPLGYLWTSLRTHILVNPVSLLARLLPRSLSLSLWSTDC